MIKRLSITRRPGVMMVLLAVVFMCMALFSAKAMAGFRVNEGKLLDGNGNPFMMRGVNHPHVWYASRTPQAIKDIASIGANSVRVVLGNGRQWGPNSASDVADVVRQLKNNRMIAVLEVHDVTGYGEKQEAAPLSTAVDYWISIKAALIGQEDFVIVNIGNEPLGNNVSADTWSRIHIDAITRLRQAGFTHTLMVDAANWGQDWEQIMLKDAPRVFAADPLGNTVFSVHMYQVYGQRSTIDNYLSTFVNTHRLPLVVGEFGADHQGQDVDEASILELAQKYKIGYLGWSWSGNSGGAESLDITYNFDVNNLSAWGNFLINSTYGIKNTASIASIFTGITPEPEPEPEPTPDPVPAGLYLTNYTINQWGTGFTANVTITNNSGKDVSGWTLTWTFANGQQVTGAWNAAVVQSGAAVSATSQANGYNGVISAKGGTASFGFQASHTGANSIPTDFKLNGVACNQGITPDPEPTAGPTPGPTPEPEPEPTPEPTPVPGGCDSAPAPGGCDSNR